MLGVSRMAQDGGEEEISYFNDSVSWSGAQ
jgi:hypothetical protein